MANINKYKGKIPLSPPPTPSIPPQSQGRNVAIKAFPPELDFFPIPISFLSPSA